MVYAQNEATGENGYKKVKQLFVKEVKTLVHLTIDGTKIDTTKEHPFFVEGEGWVEAGELKPSDKVILKSGEIGTVESIIVEELDEPVKVYNFEVEDWHTYFVSEIGVLVHNTCYEIANKAINNMNEFFGESFGNKIKGSLSKTKNKFQGQSIYEVTSKKIDSPYLTKGDMMYLDNLHKDHIEVFDKRGNAKAVLNIDGTLNLDKTEKVLKEARKLKIR